MEPYSMIKKGIVFGIVVLFFGAGVVPTISGDELICNKDPHADFTYTPSNPTSTDTVQFTDTSWDEDGVIVAWYWDFGNGYSSYLQNPVYRFGVDGTYNVSLRVWDNGWKSDTITKTIIVYTPPNNPPDAPMRPFGLRCGPRLGIAGRAYAFVTRTNDPDGDFVRYKWDWGDGHVSGWLGPHGSGAMVGKIHTWDQPGTYFIKVKAKDRHDAESDWSQILSILIIDEPT